jgi:hypothetical protein
MFLCATGCHPFWNPAGARMIRYEEFNPIYFQTSKDKTAIYLFFSQPKRLIVGATHDLNWGDGAEKHAVSFGAVANTAGNRKEYGTPARIGMVWTNDLWMMTFPSKAGLYQRPGGGTFEAQVYYSTKDSVWGIRIPFKGTKEDF